MEHLRENLLLGCGNPLLDISANVDENYLSKYDLLADNAILAEDKHKPIYNELVEQHNAEFIAGGSVQNTLRVAQWILGKKNVTTFFGCVGNDKYAKILADKAQSDGVNTQYQTTDSEPTGTCAVLVTGAKRSLVANLGAANKFTESHIHEPVYFKYLEQAEFYYISGFFLTVSPPSIQTVAKYAHDHNRLFMMNLSAPFITEFFSEPLMAAMPYIDILFGNEAESLAFAKKQNFGTEDLREIGRKMVQLPKANEKRKRVVIITQGGKHPVMLFDQDTIQEFNVVELTGDEVKDTNGAGDAFVGGFLAQLLQKQSYDVCIRCGIQAAVEIIKRSGCTFDGQFCFKL